VIKDKNKVIGHRALAVYYNQRSHSASHIQLMTSLLQEHKRLAAIESQKNSNLKARELKKQADWRQKKGTQYNNQKHFRSENPK